MTLLTALTSQTQTQTPSLTELKELLMWSEWGQTQDTSRTNGWLTLYIKTHGQRLQLSASLSRHKLKLSKHVTWPRGESQGRGTFLPLSGGLELKIRRYLQPLTCQWCKYKHNWHGETKLQMNWTQEQRSRRSQT